MPNKDKLITGLQYFNTDSRYTKSNMYFDKLIEGYFTDLPKELTIPKSTDDFFFKVDLISQNRLDLIANNFYKNSKLWWVIAEANSISNPFNIPVGTTLVIPSISSIFGTGGVLK